MDQKQKILDIAMNLNRIGNFIADGKINRAMVFVDNNRTYINEIQTSKLSPKFRKTYTIFLADYPNLEKSVQSSGQKDILAEKFMTWGNIFTHRASLL